jgi:hypothetical protein
MPKQQGEQPHDQQDRNGEDQGHRAGNYSEKRPVFPGMFSGFSEMALEQEIVAAVGLPSDVERVPEKGDGANQDTDAEVDAHAQEGDVGNAAHPCGDGNDEGQKPGQHISQAGNQADDAVDAEADPGERDAESFVEQDFNTMQCLVAKEPGAALPAAGRKPPSLACRDAGRVESRRFRSGIGHNGARRTVLGPSVSMLQSKMRMAAIVQRQNA